MGQVVALKDRKSGGRGRNGEISPVALLLALENPSPDRRRSPGGRRPRARVRGARAATQPQLGGKIMVETLERSWPS